MYRMTWVYLDVEHSADFDNLLDLCLGTQGLQCLYGHEAKIVRVEEI